jgi:hypothetical protein
MLLTVTGAWLAVVGAADAPPLDADGLAVEPPHAVAIKPMTATIVAGLLSFMGALLLVTCVSTGGPLGGPPRGRAMTIWSASFQPLIPVRVIPSMNLRWARK